MNRILQSQRYKDKVGRSKWAGRIKKKLNPYNLPFNTIFKTMCLCAYVPLCLILFPSFFFAQSVTEEFRLKKMEGKIIKWELEADSARFDENLKTLQGVKVKFYPKDKDPFIIKAEEGWVKENDKDEIYLKKNVQIIGYLKSDVKCESLSWDYISEVMYTQDKVEIEGKKWHIKGKGIEFTPSGDVMTIKKDVAMEIN